MMRVPLYVLIAFLTGVAVGGGGIFDAPNSHKRAERGREAGVTTRIKGWGAFW